MIHPAVAGSWSVLRALRRKTSRSPGSRISIATPGGATSSFLKVTTDDGLVGQDARPIERIMSTI